MSMYDVLVIGGGPGGSAAARRLSDAGLSTLLLERGAFEREKPCAGGVPIDTFSLLPEEAASVIERWVERIEFRLRERSETYASLPPRTMAMVRRSSFDSLLSRTSGAELRSGSMVTELRHGDEWAEAVDRNGRVYRGRYCIVASGSLFPFESFFNPHTPPRRGIALVSEPPLSPEYLERHGTTARFEFGTVPGGYIWIFPKQDHLSVGVGKFGPRGGEIAAATRGALTRMGVPGAEALRFRGHPIALPRRSAGFVRGRFLRVGEAAGLVDPLIGEGIRHAVRSGIMAAEAVRAGEPARYERQARREILGDLLLAGTLGELFYRFPLLSFKLGVENPLFLKKFAGIFSGRSSYRGMVARFPLYLAAAPFVRRRRE